MTNLKIYEGREAAKTVETVQSINAYKRKRPPR
jgi:hypothetical protein